MADENITRIMPNSLTAEQALVGSMLLDKDAILKASELLTKDDFYNNHYGSVYEAIVELDSEGKAVDPVTLHNRLKDKSLPPEVSSLEFITDLVNAVPYSVNAENYARIIRDKALLRKVIRVNQEVENLCFASDMDVDDILDKTEQDIFNLVQSRGNTDFVPIKEVVYNAIAKIDKVSRQKGNVTGIPTGFIDLDYQTSGLQPSDLVLIAARPSMGKTAFVLNIAQHIVLKENKNAVIFSLEMSKEQLMNRLFSLESHVDAQKLRNGNLTDREWTDLIEAADTIGRSRLIIDDTPGISIGELRSKCRKYAMDKELGVDVVIIDYLQLMSGRGRSESRQQEISEISRSLKALARELNVPVVALSQLSRAVEQRPDHRPMLSDLRESGAIEQDADVVMFIYREDYYNKDTENKNVSEIIVAKQRNGPIGTVELAWIPELTKFGNFDKSKRRNQGGEG